MLSQKSKYALRALMALSRRPWGEMVQIADIAEQEGLPRKFLEAILLEMGRNGLVHSRRGRAGGYTLAMKPEDITFGRVVRLMDGPLAPIACVSVNYYQPCLDCRDERSCEIRRVMAQVREAISSVMDQTSLADAMVNPGLAQIAGAASSALPLTSGSAEPAAAPVKTGRKPNTALKPAKASVRAES